MDNQTDIQITTNKYHQQQPYGYTPQHHQWHHFLDLIERSIDLDVSYKVILYLAYLIVFVIGIVGNIMVCYVVFKRSPMRTVTNIYIANLALSDILLCLFAVPFTPLYLLAYKEWIFGPLLCRLVPFVQAMSVYISVLTLMSIAIERYLVIIHPLQRHFTGTQCVHIVFIIWLLSFILTIPYGIFIDVIPIPIPITMSNFSPPSPLLASPSIYGNYGNYHRFGAMDTTNTSGQSTQSKNKTNIANIQNRLEHPIKTLMSIDNNNVELTRHTKWYCDEIWPNDRLRLAFGIMTSVIQFVIPFIIITFCYIKIFLRLWDRMRNRIGSRNYSSQRQWLEKKRARRTNLMLLFMVVIFVFSWLPLSTYNLIEDFYIPVTYWKHSRAMFMAFHLIAMSSTCYNPFLYTWLNDNFRKEFHSICSPLFRTVYWILGIKTHKLLQPKLGRNYGNNNIGESWPLPQSHSMLNNDQGTMLGTKTTRLMETNTGVGDPNKIIHDDDLEYISMTNIDTTTNMVTNMESINELELQESLFITSLHNGVLASRLIYNNNSNANLNNNNFNRNEEFGAKKHSQTNENTTAIH